MMTTATGAGLIEMRISKVVVTGSTEGDSFDCIVLDEAHGDRHLVIQIGSSEAFSLAATLGGTVFGRPMTYQFTAALLASLVAGSTRCGSIGWLRAPTPPPCRSKDPLAQDGWTPAPVTR
jgi:hypothetical protein